MCLRENERRKGNGYKHTCQSDLRGKQRPLSSRRAQLHHQRPSSTLSASTTWTVTVRGVLQRQNTTRRLSRSHPSHHSKERKIVPKSFRLEFCWCFPSTGYSGQGHRPHMTSDECDRCDAEAHECRRSAARALTRGPQLPAHTWGPDTARAVTCFIL